MKMLKIFQANGSRIRACNAKCSAAFRQGPIVPEGVLFAGLPATVAEYAALSMSENFCAHCAATAFQQIESIAPTIAPTPFVLSDRARLLLAHDSNVPACPCAGCSGARAARGGAATAYWQSPYNLREARPSLRN